MIRNKKTYILILTLSIACSSTYTSYSYFTSQSVEVNNNISIGELEPEEGLQEIIEANINGDILELKFSKMLFYVSENIYEGITGDKDILDNTEITIKDTSLYIKKLNGEWIIPNKKNEKNLPKISLENFEDRFGNKMKANDIYLYKNKDFNINGKLGYIVSDKGSKVDVEVLSTSVFGVNPIEGLNATTDLVFNNSLEESVAMTMNVESEIGYEELANNKKIKIISTYGSEEYSEWVDDTLEVYICYDKEYGQEGLQKAIDNVINLDLTKLIKHEFKILNIEVDFNGEEVLKPVAGTPEVEATFINAKNTIDGKNSRGSISVKGTLNTTGRFKINIKDYEGLNIEETFIAIKGESTKEIMARVTSEILNKFDTNKYILTSKEDGTRFDITSRTGINTGLTIEVEIL